MLSMFVHYLSACVKLRHEHFGLQSISHTLSRSLSECMFALISKLCVLNAFTVVISPAPCSISPHIMHAYLSASIFSVQHGGNIHHDWGEKNVSFGTPYNLSSLPILFKPIVDCKEQGSYSYRYAKARTWTWTWLKQRHQHSGGPSPQ